jgi:hypothetical protein
MRRRVLIAASAMAVLAGISANSAAADPLDRAQDPFVCPVLKVSDQAVDSSGKFGEIGDEGVYTFAPGSAGVSLNGNVPDTATNQNGVGSPNPGDHASPGDPNYTAIWSGD